MIIIRSAEHLARVLASSLDPPLRAVLEGHRERLAEYADFSFEELAAFAVIEPDDQQEALEDVTGITIRNELPEWEYFDRHDGWYELAFVLSDDGFGWIVLIPDVPAIDDRLLDLCRRHSVRT